MGACAPGMPFTWIISSTREHSKVECGGEGFAVVEMVDGQYREWEKELPGRWLNEVEMKNERT